MNNNEELKNIITNATNKLNEARALNSSDGVQIAYEAALAAVNFFSSPCEYSNSGNKYYRHEFARNLKTLREYRKNEEKLRCASILANEKSDEKHFSTLRTIRIETIKLATALNAAKLYADKNSAISYNEKAEYLCNKAVEAFTQYCTLEYNSNEQITHEFRIAKYNRLAECWYEFNSPEDNGRILREKTSRDDRLFEYDSDGDYITIRVELPNVCNNVSVFGDHDGKRFSNFYKLGTVEGDKFFNKFAEFDAKITAERIVEKAVKYAAESKAIARNTSENAAEAKATAEKAAAEAAADPDDVMKKAHANYYSDEAKKFAAYAEEVEKKAAEATKAAESYKLNVENKNNKENDMKNNNSNGLRSQNHKESKEEAEHRIAYAAFVAEMDADADADAAKEAEKAAGADAADAEKNSSNNAEKAAIPEAESYKLNVENKNNKENNMNTNDTQYTFNEFLELTTFNNECSKAAWKVIQHEFPETATFNEKDDAAVIKETIAEMMTDDAVLFQRDDVISEFMESDFYDNFDEFDPDSDLSSATCTASNWACMFMSYVFAHVQNSPYAYKIMTRGKASVNEWNTLINNCANTVYMWNNKFCLFLGYDFDYSYSQFGKDSEGHPIIECNGGSFSDKRLEFNEKEA